MVVSRLSGGPPHGTLQKVVVVQLLGGQQFRQCCLPTAQALDQPEVAEPLQSWGKNNQKIGGMARCGCKSMGHIRRDHHQVSFPGSDHLRTYEQLQLPIQDIEEFG